MMAHNTKNSKIMQEISQILGLQREESTRKRKGFTWNPLNLLGAAGFKNGKDINANEREELQKRVQQIERRVCYITDRIDQCEQSRFEEDTEEDEADANEEESEPDPDPEEKNNTYKSSQNFMVLLKQLKMRKQSNDSPKTCTYKERRKKPQSRESKSVVWSNKPCLEEEYKTSNDNIDLENKTANVNKLLNQGQTTLDGGRPMHQFKRQTNKESSRILSNETVTKKNVKMIIDEAVLDSIGKTLHKYFKEGLEKYIKNRVESAVHMYNDVEEMRCYTPRTQTSFSMRPKTRTKESIQELHNYQSTIKDPDNILRAVETGCPVKTVSSDCLTNATMESYDQNKFQNNNTKMKCKYSDIKSWVNKRQRLKPVSAPSHNKSMLNLMQGTESNKTIQILKGNTTKPFPNERTFPKKFMRRKLSRDSLANEN